MTQQRMESRDRGWAWCVLLACYFLMFIIALPFAIGVYVNELIRELNLEHTTAGLFGAVQIATVMLGGVFTCLSDRFTHRVVICTAGVLASVSYVASIYLANIYVLFFTFALIPGVCMGIVFVQCICLLNRYFDKYANIANGIATSGFGLGNIMVPYIVDTIIDVYSWRQSLYIVAGITLQGTAFALLLRPISSQTHDDKQTKSQEIKTSQNSRKELLSDHLFYIFVITNICWAMSVAVVFVLGPNLYYERGISNFEISVIMALIGVGNMLARVAYSVLLQMCKWDVMIMHVVNVALTGVIVVMFIVHDSFIYFAIVGFAFGVVYGMSSMSQLLACRALKGVQNYDIVYGCVVGFLAVGITGGPPLSGYIFDQTNSYVIAYIVNCAISVFGATVLGVSICVRRCHKTPQVLDSADIHVSLIDIGSEDV